jgi:hypothetical protein
MNKLTLKLMRQSAVMRWQDAQTLRNADPLGDRSDSEDLLSLLAFELLLKCLLRMRDITPGERGHHYLELFNQLPENIRSEILELAITRIGPDCKLKTDHELVLKTWGKNFIKLRYAYEDYEHVTAGEFTEMGEEWLALGAIDERAMTVLYSNELFGIMEALLDMTSSLE